MDWITIKVTCMEYIKKYRYVMIALLIGLLLMILPESNSGEMPPIESVEIKEFDLEEKLSNILSMIDGAGKVKVLLTEAEGEKIFYQTDESHSSDTSRIDTVLVNNGNREECGLRRQILSPVYRGAIILCQGADNAAICLSIVNAVKDVTGLSSDRITVLKMK